MPERLTVGLDSGDSVTALLYPAEKSAGITLILAHGAGAGQTSAFMVSFAAALAARGLDLVTFDFLYTEQGRRLPDPNARLETCWRAVIDSIRREQGLARNRLAIGGKSMGGRIASQVAAAGAAAEALVFLGYPLHPPGKPLLLRSRHLPKIAAPMLFVQGERDPFGTPEELAPILKPLRAPAEIYPVASGDHSFKVLKRAGVAQAAVYAQIQDKIAAWLRATLG
jgi:predicted alpha/beta-hydrolase family hydrolase